MSNFNPTFRKVSSAGESARNLNDIHGGTVANMVRSSLTIRQVIDLLEHGGKVSLHDIRAIHGKIFATEESKNPGGWRNRESHVACEDGTVFTYPWVADVPILMQELEPFTTEIKDIDAWYRQFQLIHPFNDGNGRVGGVLYTAWVYHKTKEWWTPCQ